jgi:AAHS family 4-hydroxybenzoate transporter-like MFS transporter
MNVIEIIDRQQLGRFQLKIIILCGLVQFFDGFDMQMLAYTAPAIMHDWGVPHAAFGSVFAAGMLGIVCGTAFLSPLADRIGRKKMLIAAVLLFAIMTFMIAGAQNLIELRVLRFFTGFGLAAVLPCTTVMVSEYAPKRRQATMITLMSIGFAVGAAAGGQLNALLLPLIGWRGAFCIGGAFPLLLIIALMRYLPESLRYLAVKGGRDDEIARTLRKMEPGIVIPAGTRFYTPNEQPQRAPVIELFVRKRLAITLLLWVVISLNLLMMNFLNNWLPSVLTGAGLTVTQAVRATTLFQFGGIIGILLMGYITDRRGYFPVLIAAFVLQAVVAASIALGGGSIPVLLLAIPFAGLAVVGVNNMLAALTTTLYPTAMRATGSGWANSFGHLVALAGPIIGGILIGLGWPIRDLFFLLAAVPACGTIGMVALAAYRTHQLKAAAAATVSATVLEPA